MDFLSKSFLLCCFLFLFASYWGIVYGAGAVLNQGRVRESDGSVLENDSTDYLCKLCLLIDQHGNDVFAGRHSKQACWDFHPRHTRAVNAGEFWSIECGHASDIEALESSRREERTSSIDVRVGQLLIESTSGYRLSSLMHTLHVDRHIQLNHEINIYGQDEIVRLAHPRRESGEQRTIDPTIFTDDVATAVLLQRPGVMSNS
jgi:hypothetical protein